MKQRQQLAAQRAIDLHTNRQLGMPIKVSLSVSMSTFVEREKNSLARHFLGPASGDKTSGLFRIQPLVDWLIFNGRLEFLSPSRN